MAVNVLRGNEKDKVFVLPRPCTFVVKQIGPHGFLFLTVSLKIKVLVYVLFMYLHCVVTLEI
jgi:hypothetical protein